MAATPGGLRASLLEGFFSVCYLDREETDGLGNCTLSSDFQALNIDCAHAEGLSLAVLAWAGRGGWGLSRDWMETALSEAPATAAACH